jgi:hypothetical protein
MTRASIWLRSPDAALPWLPSPQQRKPCEILVDTQWTDRGGIETIYKNYLTDLLRCLKEAKAEYEKLQ